MKNRSGMKWTDEEMVKAKKLLKDEGLTMKEVARRLGRTEKAVQARLSVGGVTRVSNAWSEGEVERVLGDLRKGKHIKDVAKKYGRSEYAIRNYLNREGYSLQTLQRIRASRGRRGISGEEIRDFKLEEGKDYRIRCRDARGWHIAKHDLTCVKNYDNYIRFRREGGAYECYLKVDMLSNPSMVKEL